MNVKLKEQLLINKKEKSFTALLNHGESVRLAIVDRLEDVKAGLGESLGGGQDVLGALLLLATVGTVQNGLGDGGGGASHIVDHLQDVRGAHSLLSSSAVDDSGGDVVGGGIHGVDDGINVVNAGGVELITVGDGLLDGQSGVGDVSGCGRDVRDAGRLVLGGGGADGEEEDEGELHFI